MKKVNLIFIICFCIMLVVPILATDYKGGEISSTENRNLAAFPNFPELISVSELSLFKNNFEIFLNDNIGFRENLYKTNVYLNYNLFNVSAKTDTLIGKNNWLFYYYDYMLLDFQNKIPPTTDYLYNFAKNFEKLDNYCDINGSKFYFLYLPDKKTIYPEEYKGGIVKVSKLSRSQIIVDYLKDNTEVKVVYPYDELILQKETNLVYSSVLDNAHWNTLGAFVGYNALFNVIKEDIEDFIFLDFDDYDINENSVSGKFCDTIPIEETTYEFIPKKEQIIVRDDTTFDNLDYLPKSDYHFINESNKEAPKLLLIGDSYSSGVIGVMEIICANFSEVVLIHIFEAEHISKIIDIYNPDIVIYEVVERMTPDAIPLLFEGIGNLSE